MHRLQLILHLLAFGDVGEGNYHPVDDVVYRAIRHNLHGVVMLIVGSHFQLFLLQRTEHFMGVFTQVDILQTGRQILDGPFDIDVGQGHEFFHLWGKTSNTELRVETRK